MPYKDPAKHREYVRRWIEKRRREFFKDKKCLVCGSTERLELHHLDPAKKISHHIFSWSLERRLAEIAKCVILCQSCHKMVTRFVNNQRSARRDTVFAAPAEERISI